MMEKQQETQRKKKEKYQLTVVYLLTDIPCLLLAPEKFNSSWLEVPEATRYGNIPKSEFQSKVATIPR